ncbi:hypothetical protein Calab_3413 [Caldithrix abyssi DSM 13497]|uniref:VWA domain-containing protein n=1 Tax=Caldithrix abyssi DSM 13497 TaxID=880073 RepID=H1XWA8_CALAY|nr:VWA domain-containing protein [Caldithrix abyssi]APF19073.1 hypothetical protein Cabys_2324 [Caldithrix abyssi DSM 13497]EHO43013.1 hypothetical protein Calab_3413 [Caldithrix abyssi DSM 13497]
MPELIQFNIPFIVVLLTAAAAFAVSYFFYRKTNPPIPEYARWVLLMLRALVFFLLFLIFFTPAVKLIFVKEKAEKIAVFFDNSRSMNVKDGDKMRWESVEKVAQALVSKKPASEIKWFTFNASVQPLSHPDSLKPSEGATNFQAVFNAIRKQKPDRAIIVSDGVVTEGRIPSLTRKIGSQVFTVVVGRAQSQTDVFISEVKSPASVYRNEEVKADIVIGAEHLKKAVSLILTVKMDNKLLAQKRITLTPGNGRYSVPLSYKLDKLGLHHLTFEIERVKGEANTANNRFHVVQEVLKSRKNVGLFTAYPNYDLKFLKLAIEKFPRFKTFTFVENNRGKFIVKDAFQNLDSMDVWIFVDFPGKNTSGILIDQLRKSWETTRQNVLLMPGGQFSNSRFRKIFGQFLRFNFSPLSAARELTPITVNSPGAATFLNLFEESARNQQFWSMVPPLQSFYPNLQTGPKDVLLIQSILRGRAVPLIFLSETKLKAVVINGLGLWRWHFLLQPDERLAAGYTVFIEKIVGWLSKRTPFKPVLLKVDRKRGNIGQKFQLEIQLVDSRGQSIQDGTAALMVKGEDQSFNLPVQKDQAGHFSAEFIPVREGNYKIIARGFQQNEFWGSDSTSLIIIPVNKELIQLKPDTLFLKKLALINNGRMIPADSLNAVQQIVSGKQQYVRQKKEVELWYKLGLLILILTLITLEWSLRKKWNLI